MRRRTTAILFTAACPALAGCSISDSDKPEPAKSTLAATSGAPVELSAADRIKACTDAIAAGSDSSAPECADLSADDYMKALQDANQQGRDALQDLIDEAPASAQP
ncbi:MULTISPECIES: hypothetical protein [unclassified Streptomyces]|uniref:hypothetical protein n=1 Tax=unclassified Streptomyces TaxID=2593676 RepID=UPI0023672FFF|nr:MULTISPECIES: hypothetical protein [unclassified Streptomyces]MDF3146441.1 hypothetical protein [Streptomyces sp. T21Q-yed]WDF42111.1 hypothetical protein PBV52_37595 [Streptomyces sp. T12]